MAKKLTQREMEIKKKIANITLTGKWGVMKKHY